MPGRPKTTTLRLQQKKARSEPITVLTAYDYPTALALDRAGVDAILVGDSLGMVVLGYETTLAVTMDDMLHHCRAVARAAKRAHLIGDMPFMSYQVSTEDAVRNAGRFLQEAGMDAVKMEGGRERSAAIAAVVTAGIPVMGHLGLQPQRIHQLGGWRVQGRSSEAARRLVEDAVILQSCGCYAIVLESIPSPVAELITRKVDIPTIGIGAGPACDGQVLVTHDLLGLFDRFTPKFVRKYADLQSEMARAFSQYLQDVSARRFPGEENSDAMDEGEYRDLCHALDDEKWDTRECFNADFTDPTNDRGSG